MPGLANVEGIQLAHIGSSFTSMGDLGGNLKEKVVLDVAGLAVCLVASHCAAKFAVANEWLGS